LIAGFARSYLNARGLTLTSGINGAADRAVAMLASLAIIESPEAERWR
jgi:hypothetical protein